MALGEEVKYITLYKLLPVWAHGYILPFLFFYVSLVCGWLYVFGGLLHVEALLICVAGIAAINVVTCLSCVWSVHIRCLMTCRKVSLQTATHVKVVPTPNNGYSELVSLRRKKDGREVCSFVFQNIKYVCEEGEFSPLLFPVDLPVGQYTQRKGFANEEEIKMATEKYGLNKLTVVSPDFWTLFRERATAPFFVFQVFCVGLWCLDEYWYYSVFTLMMLVMFESLLVQQQKRNLAEIQKMGATPFKISVYRTGRWIKLDSDKLLPGDIISFGRTQSGNLCPCDLLVLRGSCIVDESMLTGESVPQMKEPLEATLSVTDSLNMARDGKLHVVYGGTRIVQHTSPTKSGAELKAPDNGCIGYVLRTGFNTSQGKLLRTILFGVKRVTANNLETFMFILFLLVFAVSASAYVWIKGTENPDRNRYKLFLECTLILTSVVPPELPIELSLAVNTSLIALAKIGIYCTEPFRIPFGGKVDICCFDKTGTLTSDNLVVQGIAGLNSASSKAELISAADTPLNTQTVLGSCHSLTMLDGELVGDPLEKAALIAVGWKLSKNDTVSSVRGQRCSLNIIHRFHFSSALKRMSTVSAMTTPTECHIACVKGAPEVIKSMLSHVPDNYDALYLKLARKGSRVLALGHRNLGRLSLRDANSLRREDVEKELTFAGFIAINCPLKKHTKDCVKELQESSHHVTMITGDNPLTACHVAKELKITRDTVMILQHYTSNNEWYWESVKGDVRLKLDTDRRAVHALLEGNELCVTGQGIQHLMELGGDRLLKQVLPLVKVFARVSPKQKELIINTLKSRGFYTLMCGDGTNDVGALKHAHVGVSLLSTVRVTPQEDTSTGGNQLTRTPLSSVRNRKAPPTKEKTQNQPTPRNKLLQDFIKKSEEGLTDPALVRLGDASIASPFTSRETNIRCICHVIKQGRCTLVTTLQMFKILAINALILAYSQSVLYLDGIKFSDLQATLQGVLLAGCFLFISRSKPLDTLSQARPLANVFNIYTVLTVSLQFVVHFCCLIYLVQEAKQISPPSEEEFVDLEKDFEQSITNSAVYIISVAMQTGNFAVNYKGHPFMVGLTANKPLLYSLMVTSTVVLMLAAGLFSDLCEWLEIVEFPVEFQTKLFVVLLVDFLGTFLIDRVLAFLFGTARLRKL